MNDKFGRDRHRDDRNWGRRDDQWAPRNDRFSGRDDRYHEDRYGEDRAMRSPDSEFETSEPYRQPTDEAWRGQPRYGLSDYDRYAARSRFSSNAGRNYGGAIDRQGYAPSPYVPAGELRGGFYGRGPKGYTRTDERIREDVCERLSWNDEVDATDITVRVESGEVTLEGSVPTRHMKRLAADIAEDVAGVLDVHNVIRATKPLLTELKEKVTGEQTEQHHANTGTRTTGSAGLTEPRNGAV